MIFNSNQVIIDHFSMRLISGYGDVYGEWKMEYGQIVKWAASIACQIHSNLGDAPYHGLLHTIDVTLVGMEILKGLHIERRVMPKEWLHFMIACAFHDIGFVRNLLPGDAENPLPRGCTGAAFNDIHVDRGREFVLLRFKDHEIIDAEWVADLIEQTRFPVPEGERYRETGTLRGLVRGADFIGQLANLHHGQNQRDLFYEFTETGMAEKLGFKDIDDLRDDFPSFFFNVVKPYVRDSVIHLQRTEDGRQIANNLIANVFRAQYKDFP